MIQPSDFRTNRLLAALPADEYQRLLPSLEAVSMPIETLFYESNKPIKYIYFPITAMASILVTMADGTLVEAGIVGNEGLVGLPVFFGTERTPTLAICQVAGDAIRLRVEAFQVEIKLGGSLVTRIQRYAQAYFTMLAQNSACNSQHSLRERCSRWLLVTHDRVAGDEFGLTQEFLSHMLAVRRAGVNEVMQTLQNAGIIRYSRGVIQIIDRAGLEDASCECYGIIAAEYARLLG